MTQTKKELKNQYKQTKPEMGVFLIRNKETDKCFIGASTDIRSMFNRIQFQLNMGTHPDKSLQKDWRTCGENAFVFEVLDPLAYSKAENKTDYREDLKTLKSLWLDKIKEDNKRSLY